MDTLQREYWTGPPVLHSIGWRLQKHVGEREREAVCELWTHQLGWELRLVVDGGEFQRSQVARSIREMLDVVDHWKEAMTGKGWA